MRWVLITPALIYLTYVQICLDVISKHPNSPTWLCWQRTSRCHTSGKADQPWEQGSRDPVLGRAVVAAASDFCERATSCNHHSSVSIFVLSQTVFDGKCLQNLRKDHTAEFGDWIIKNKS